MELVHIAGEELLLLLASHRGEIPAPGKHSDRLVRGWTELASYARLRRPISIQRLGRPLGIQRSHISGDPARDAIEGACVGMDQEHLVLVARKIDVDRVAARTKQPITPPRNSPSE